MPRLKCNPKTGYHVYSADATTCRCGERQAVVYAEPAAPEQADLFVEVPNLQGCARCGKDHRVRFKELQRPMVAGDSTLTHWAICPTTGEPIMMRFVDVPDASQI